MSRLVDIPRLEQRLKTHITTLTWNDSADEVEKHLDSIGEAGLCLSECLLLSVGTAAELKDDSCLPCFKEILALILAIGISSHLLFSCTIGNYMNGGTNKGQAYGIKLSALVSLPLID